MIVAEAMLMKVPVIGSNSGGVPEIISNENKGLLFETKNDDDLLEKINSIIENKYLREKIIINAYNFANKKYDYHQHFVRLEKIIDTL